MPNRVTSGSCTDPIVGAILSGWRYDISSISKEMRTDYEQHLAECGHCRHRQRLARTIDVLLLSVTTLSMVAFMLVGVVLHRIELLTHVSSLHVHLHRTPITISLEAVAMAGVLGSIALGVLVAMATPLPVLVRGVVQRRILARRHA